MLMIGNREHHLLFSTFRSSKTSKQDSYYSANQLQRNSIQIENVIPEYIYVNNNQN